MYTMRSMYTKRINSGFTIVELLIVIIVIAILAAIVVATYNGVQQKARASAAASDLSNIASKAQYGLSSLSTGQYPTTTDMYNVPDLKVNSVSQGVFSLISYCSSNTSAFVAAAQTKDGNTYYVQNGTTVTQNNSVNAAQPCASLGVKNADNSAPSTTFIGMPSTACASENTTCSGSGTVNVAFGYAPLGQFTAKANMVLPFSCSNATFGIDPSVGNGKACYILQY